MAFAPGTKLGPYEVAIIGLTIGFVARGVITAYLLTIYPWPVGRLYPLPGGIAANDDFASTTKTTPIYIDALANDSQAGLGGWQHTSDLPRRSAAPGRHFR